MGGFLEGVFKGAVAALVIFVILIGALKSCMLIVEASEPVNVRPSNDRTIEGMAWPYERRGNVRLMDGPLGEVIVIEGQGVDTLAVEGFLACDSSNKLYHIMLHHINERIAEDPSLRPLYEDTIRQIEESYCYDHNN